MTGDSSALAVGGDVDAAHAAMNRAPRGRLAVVALALACLAGCGANFQLIQESLSDEKLLATAGPIALAPLQFVVAPEESPEVWAEYLAIWNAAYTETLVTELRDLGVAAPQRLNPGEVALEGSNIVVTVREIRHGYSMGLGDDRLVAQVQVLDAASRQARLAAEIEVSSYAAGSQRYYINFPARIRHACISLGRAVAHGVQHGTFQR